MHQEEIISSMQGREVIYAFFSDIYLFLADDKHVMLLKEILPALKEICQGSSEVKESIELLENYTDKYIKAENKQELLDNLNMSYTRLYCLGNGVPLSESVYVSPIHLTRQETEIEAGKIYRLCNFDMKHNANEPQDHLSYELMFMSYLSKGISKHLSANNIQEASKLTALQKEFLSNHILNWIEEMCMMTKKIAESHEFYYPLTEILKSYLKADNKYLETLEF